MAYRTSQARRQRIKDAVLDAIAPEELVGKCGRELYRVSGATVHARYCAPGPGNYKFNINPNTLRADYELWICGTADHWYLVPIAVIATLYEHPRAYPDTHHPEIRVVSVGAREHSVMYAAPSISLDLAPYFRATLGAEG